MIDADMNVIESPVGGFAEIEPADRISSLDVLLQLLERRWAMMIISRLCRRPLRFSELQRAIPGMSPKMMLDRLRDLEQHGIVERVTFPEDSSRLKYTLTSSGKQLRPAVNALFEWASARELH